MNIYLKHSAACMSMGFYVHLFLKFLKLHAINFRQVFKQNDRYIYIVIHRQICFVLSELISVARQYLPVAGIETRLTQTPSQSF